MPVYLSDALKQCLPPPTYAAINQRAWIEFSAGYVGNIHSGEFTPGGAQMSQNTGRKFARGMLKKRQTGKL